MTRIGDRAIAADTPPYVIAEIGVNHDGSPAVARRLIEAAASAKANAIKLQYFEASRLLSRAAILAAYQRAAGAVDPVGMLQTLELDADTICDLAEHARQCGVHAIVTVFSVELVDGIEAAPFDAFKTASTDLVNRPLIERLMATGRPLLLSTGAATLSEVEETLAWLGPYPHLLFQCVSRYPTPDDAAAIAGRLALARIDPFALGYSDHTTSVDTGALAVAGGACILEKHLTHDRAAPGPDHAASLDPNGLSEYVHLAHRAWRMRGPVEKLVTAEEGDVRMVSRQSITSTRDLPAGTVLAATDLTIKRPGSGIPAARRASLLGRRLARDVAANTPLVDEDLS